MKKYTVVYISYLDFCERFRIYANNKKDAMKKCRENLGGYCRRITEVYED